MLINPADDSFVEIKGGERESTNNRMELMAPIAALRSLHGAHEVQIITDSTYVKNGITRWIDHWVQSNWRTRSGKGVKNRELWQQLHSEIQRHRVSWSWVKGHSNNRWNDLADSLATAGRVQEKEPPGVDDKAVHMYIGITFKQASAMGGWCVIMKYRHHIKVDGGRVSETTANRLYIESAILALQHLKRNVPIYIYTYSGYLRDGVHSWMGGWSQRNWQTRDGRDVSNRMQWQELKVFLDSLRIKIILVDKEKSHCLLQEAKEMAKEYELF